MTTSVVFSGRYSKAALDFRNTNQSLKELGHHSEEVLATARDRYLKWFSEINRGILYEYKRLTLESNDNYWLLEESIQSDESVLFQLCLKFSLLDFHRKANETYKIHCNHLEFHLVQIMKCHVPRLDEISEIRSSFKTKATLVGALKTTLLLGRILFVYIKYLKSSIVINPARTDIVLFTDNAFENDFYERSRLKSLGKLIEKVTKKPPIIVPKNPLEKFATTNGYIDKIFYACRPKLGEILSDIISLHKLRIRLQNSSTNWANIALKLIAIEYPLLLERRFLLTWHFKYLSSLADNKQLTIFYEDELYISGRIISIASSRIEGIESFGLQHGYFDSNHYVYGKSGLSAGDTLANPPVPDVFLVWSEYFRKEFVENSSIAQLMQIISVGNPHYIEQSRIVRQRNIVKEKYPIWIITSPNLFERFRVEVSEFVNERFQGNIALREHPSRRIGSEELRSFRNSVSNMHISTRNLITDLQSYDSVIMHGISSVFFQSIGIVDEVILLNESHELARSAFSSHDIITSTNESKKLTIMKMRPEAMEHLMISDCKGWNELLEKKVNNEFI